MNTRDFLGEEFYAWVQNEHDKIRFRLKRQKGKPDADSIQLFRLDREWAQLLNRIMGV